ncbi:MAG: hypothetical protein WAR22_14575 [Desulfomonilia bacterium]
MDVLKTVVMCAIALPVLSGCAGYNRDLLDRDYTVMTDEELLTYYYDLSSAIDRCARDPGSATVGVGSGFGLGRLGIWLGLSRGIATCDPQRLIQRQARVRLELRERGLSP